MSENSATETLRLPWKPLDPEAFEASQAHIAVNGGRPPLAMKIIAERSSQLGHSLSETEYRELVQKDELPEEHQQCSWPGCHRPVSPFRTALVLKGEVMKNRDGNTVWRGAFLVLKLAEGGLQVRGFCAGHLSEARQSAEEAACERIHPMPFAESVARREGIIDAARRRQDAREAFEASLAGRSTALKGRFGSAPRNRGDLGARR